MQMNEQEFERERVYQMTMLHFKGMLREGLITDKEYRAIDAKMIEKYRPVSGGVFSEISLLCAMKRGNIGHGKEE